MRSPGLVFACFVLAGLAPAARGAPPEAALEQQMVLLVNRSRQDHGLRPLTGSPKLAGIARGHSAEMADAGFFSHTSPATGAPEDRIFRAGIRCSRTGENIARDRSVDDAQDHLMQSPGHRANILKPEFTHIGVGIVRRGEDLYITQNFVTAIPRVETANWPKVALVEINARRRKRGLPAVSLDPRLQPAAQAAADSMNRGQELKREEFKRRIQALRIRYYTMQFWVAVSTDPYKFREAELLMDRRVEAVGLGFSRNETQENGLGALWMALVGVDLY